MIISGPEKLIHAVPGTVCHSVVELQDVMPTFLDIAGADIPDSVDGRSMMPLAANPELTIRGWLHGEHEAGKNSNHFIVTEHDKYVWYSQTGQEQYFNLDEDRRELHDGIHDEIYQERIEELRRLMIDVLKDREERYSDGEKLIAGRTPVVVLKAAMGDEHL